MPGSDAKASRGHVEEPRLVVEEETVNVGPTVAVAPHGWIKFIYGWRRSSMDRVASSIDKAT